MYFPYVPGHSRPGPEGDPFKGIHRPPLFLGDQGWQPPMRRKGRRRGSFPSLRDPRGERRRGQESSSSRTAGRVTRSASPSARRRRREGPADTLPSHHASRTAHTTGSVRNQKNPLSTSFRSATHANRLPRAGVQGEQRRHEQALPGGPGDFRKHEKAQPRGGDVKENAGQVVARGSRRTARRPACGRARSGWCQLDIAVAEKPHADVSTVTPPCTAGISVDNPGSSKLMKRCPPSA